MVFTAPSVVAGEGTVESVFCQNFTAGLPGIGETVSVALKEDGDDIMVTEENRREYVDLFVDFYLNGSVNKQVRSEMCRLALSLLFIELLSGSCSVQQSMFTSCRFVYTAFELFNHLPGLDSSQWWPQSLRKIPQRTLGSILLLQSQTLKINVRGAGRGGLCHQQKDLLHD